MVYSAHTRLRGFYDHGARRLRLSSRLQANGVTLTLDLAQNLPAVLADLTQLQQVVVNLAMDAIQAMSQTDPASRELVVRSSRESSGVKSHVDDAGPGIAANH